MSKINVKITLTTPETTIEKKYKAIFLTEEKEIIYQEDDKTKTKINLQKLRLERENETLWMEYLFNKQKPTKGTIKIKDLNQQLKLNIQTKKINQQNQNIEIEYQLENENYKYKLEVIK